VARCLLIIGNSVSFPPAGGDSYPQLIQARLGDAWKVNAIIKGGATLDEMQSEVLKAICRDLPAGVVLQVGINECAPRPLGRSGRDRLGRLRPIWLRQRIIGLLHKYRPEIIRLRGPKQLTSATDFSRSVADVIAAARGCGAAVLVLPIMRVPASAEVRTPFLNREIARYNARLATLSGSAVRFMSESEIFPSTPPEKFCAGPETVHLDAAAHRRIAQVVVDWVGIVLAGSLKDNTTDAARV